MVAWHTPTPLWRTELKRIWCNTPSIALLSLCNLPPRNCALGARRLVGGRGEKDPPHLRILLTEEDIEAAHGSLNAHRRNGVVLIDLNAQFGGTSTHPHSHHQMHPHTHTLVVGCGVVLSTAPLQATASILQHLNESAS